MLHVTNGESVSLADTGLGGEVLCWRDSLHGEGEPANLDADEIVLWFEHDLFDQAQLIEILARLRGRQGVSLICTDRYLGPLTGEQLRELWPLRHSGDRGGVRTRGSGVGGVQLGRPGGDRDAAGGRYFGPAVSGGGAAAALTAVALSGERPGADGAPDSGDHVGRRTHVPHIVPGAGASRGAHFWGTTGCGTGFAGWWNAVRRC